MTNVINLSSRRKPALTKTDARDYNGMLSAEKPAPTTIERILLSEFMLTDLDTAVVTPAQIVTVQTAIATAFNCGGVFMALNNTGPTIELICIPVTKNRKGEWRPFSFLAFFTKKHTKTDVFGARYTLKQLTDLVGRFTKLPLTVTIKVIRKPSQTLWSEFQNGRKIKQ